MIYGLYCVKDLKTGYLTPMTDMNDYSAMRNFEHACSNIDSLFYTHPGDYQLFKIGTFNTEDATIVTENTFIMDAPQRKD